MIPKEFNTFRNLLPNNCWPLGGGKGYNIRAKNKMKIRVALQSRVY